MSFENETWTAASSGNVTWQDIAVWDASTGDVYGEGILNSDGTLEVWLDHSDDLPTSCW